MKYESQKRWVKENKEWLKQYKHEHYLANKEKYIQRAKESEKKDPLKQKRNYENNKEKRLKWCKEYREKNIDICREKERKYMQKRRSNDIKFKIKQQIYHRMYLALKNNFKKGNTIELLGCSIDEYKKYLFSKFLPGMTFENYGQNGWTIDHIIPCSKFDLSKKREQKKCFHYMNTQPMWHIDNIKKGNKI